MTTVQLFGDIGLYANYKQTVNFTSVTAQNSWFNAKQHTTVQNVIYNKPQNSLKLNMEYGQAIKYSYVRLLDLDSTGRIYYFFISQVNVIDDATVEFILEPDVIQTYMTFWTLKESMVNRAHVDRWSADSDLPARITPNDENPTSFMNVIRQHSFVGDDEQLTVVIAYTRDFKPESGLGDTRSVISYASFPINLDGTPILGMTSTTEGEGSSSLNYPYYFPTLDEVISGEFSTMFAIAPEDIISVSIVPIWGYGLTPAEATAPSLEGRIGYYYNYSELGGSPPKAISDDNPYFGAITGTGAKPIEGETNTVIASIRMAQVNNGSTFRGTGFNYIGDTVPTNMRPTKPTDGDTASETYEPALFISPYQKYIINDGLGTTILEMSPSTVMNAEFKPFIHADIMVSGGGVTLNICGQVSPSEDVAHSSLEGSGSNYSCITADVINDKWLQYRLTERDTDRQIVSNNNLSNVLSGAIFGAYGGALVSSRGQSGKDKGTQKLISKMIPGIVIGGIASMGAAVIDSHFAWENQLAKEKGIQNQPSNLLQVGSGAGLLQAGIVDLQFSIMKCDDIAFGRAYDNFRKYGYSIDRFEEIDINSRKYFNYVMTNGAVIGGAIPEDVRDLIASIFDAGVTIYHGDYCDTLEYPTQENIERSLIT